MKVRSLLTMLVVSRLAPWLIGAGDAVFGSNGGKIRYVTADKRPRDARRQGPAISTVFRVRCRKEG